MAKARKKKRLTFAQKRGAAIARSKASSKLVKCGCGPAKSVRIKDASGGGRHVMCRDVNGVTRKRSGKKRQPGSFSKAANKGCK